MNFLALVKRRLGVPSAAIRKGEKGSSLGENENFSWKCFSVMAQNELVGLNGTTSWWPQKSFKPHFF